MNVKKAICLFLCSTLLPQLAWAESKANAVTFILNGGYIFFSPKRDLHNTTTLGAALAYNFTEQWAIQLAADLLNADSGDPSKHHVHGFVYLLDGLYHFHPIRIFEPYVMAGMNVTSLKPISSEPVNQGGMNIGAGTLFLKSNHIALSVEARDIYTFSGGKNDILLNGGINFMWE